MKLDERAFVLCAAAVVLVVFGPSLGGDFVWDDALLIAKNADLLAPGGLRRLMTSDLWGGAGGAHTQLYHPIPVLTFWVQAHLTGLRIIPMRIFNLALHVGCGALLFRWLRAREIAPGVAFFAALLFLVHPSVTEPVMWLTGRHDTLGAIFILLAVLAWEATLSRAILASLACAAAFLCKEAFVCAPLLLAIVALAEKRGRRALLFLPFVATASVFVVRRSVGIASDSSMTSVGVLTLARHYATIVHHFFVQCVTFRDSPTTLSYAPLGAMAAILVLVVAAGACVFAVRERRAVGLVWFLIALAPLILAVPLIGMWGNRYAYVPMLGLFVAGAHVVDARLRTVRATPWIGAAVIALCALLTGLRARHFRSELALFGADLAAMPDDARALYHYGTAVQARGGCPESIAYFMRSAERDPTYARPLRNVAGCALNLRRYDLAEQAARSAMSLEPKNPTHPYHLAAALAAEGAIDAARVAVLRSLELDPTYQPAQKLLQQLPR